MFYDWVKFPCNVHDAHQSVHRSMDAESVLMHMHFFPFIVYENAIILIALFSILIPAFFRFIAEIVVVHVCCNRQLGLLPKIICFRLGKSSLAIT